MGLSTQSPLLSANSLGLDLYALLAYRLPRLEQEVHLRWGALQAQIRSAERTSNTLAARIREVMPDVPEWRKDKSSALGRTDIKAGCTQDNGRWIKAYG